MTRSIKIAIFGLSLAASALAGPTGVAVTPRLKFRTGAGLRYQVTIRTTIGMSAMPSKSSGTEATISMTLLSHVDRTLPNGDAVVTRTVRDYRMVLGGAAGPAANVPPLTVTLSPTGEVVSAPAPDASGSGNPLAMGRQFGFGDPSVISLPPGPVRVGESWSRKFKPSGLATIATVKSTLVGVDTVNGKRIARVRAMYAMPLGLTTDGAGHRTLDSKLGAMFGSGGFTYEQDSDFALDAGELLKSRGHGTLSLTMKPGAAASAPAIGHRPPPPETMTARIVTSLDLEPESTP